MLNLAVTMTAKFIQQQLIIFIIVLLVVVSKLHLTEKYSVVYLSSLRSNKVDNLIS